MTLPHPWHVSGEAESSKAEAQAGGGRLSAGGAAHPRDRHRPREPHGLGSVPIG